MDKKRTDILFYLDSLKALTSSKDNVELVESIRVSLRDMMCSLAQAIPNQELLRATSVQVSAWYCLSAADKWTAGQDKSIAANEIRKSLEFSLLCLMARRDHSPKYRKKMLKKLNEQFLDFIREPTPETINRIEKLFSTHNGSAQDDLNWLWVLYQDKLPSDAKRLIMVGYNMLKLQIIQEDLYKGHQDKK